MAETREMPHCCQILVMGSFEKDTAQEGIKAALQEYETDLAHAKARFELDKKFKKVAADKKFYPEDYAVDRDEYDLPTPIAEDLDGEVTNEGLVLATTRQDTQQLAGKELQANGFKQLVQFKNPEGNILILWGKNLRPVEKAKAPKKGVKKASKKAKK